ncbi:sulfotransferase [Nannocystaceae bacterium ST9]
MTGLINSFRVVLLLIEVFGFRWRQLGLLGFRIALTSFTALTLALDHLFFPRGVRTPLDRPVFLIGHLRSGTTFLHRWLTETFPFRSLLLWEMVFPALTARLLLRPFLRFMQRVSFDRVYDPNIHETGFFAAETDDIALSMRYFDGLLSWIYFHAWREYPDDAAFERALAETVEKPRFVRYLAAVYRRAVHRSGLRMFSKSFCLLFNMDQVRAQFPGAKFLLIVRDPVESVVSMCSLEHGIQRRINDIDAQSESLRKRYFDNLVRTSAVYYRRLCVEARRAESDTLILTYPSLFSDFEGTMTRVARFLDIELDAATELLLREQAGKQGDYASQHRYSAAAFGLSDEAIRREFGFVYAQFEDLRMPDAQGSTLGA